MLYISTVHTGTLALLKELMQMDELKSFSLVGGTALSLQFGHRISEDLDLFSNETFDKDYIIDALEKKFEERFFYEERGNKWGVFCYIDKIKVDIVKFPHPLIRPVITEDEIRMYSPQDIIAMKVAAILRRAKKKDFWDIAELLDHFSVDDFVKFFFEKYPKQILAISIPQVMTYFADAELETTNPVSLKGQTWKAVKSKISQSVREYLK